MLSCLFIWYIAGVICSPPDAVHGLNHDYHAFLHKRAADYRSIQAQDGTFEIATAPWRVLRGTDPIAPPDCMRAAPAPFLLLAFIETWRLLL